ncbi:MAG: hypothetical protein DDT40_01372 [candidate division WS2 bacterium]|nr:hypothetical protein [Candidatus Psychracetigena formicireducens]
MLAVLIEHFDQANLSFHKLFKRVVFGKDESSSL